MRQPAARLADSGEIPAEADPPVAPQGQSLGGGGHVELGRRQPFTSDPASVGQNGLSALAAIARQEAMLPFATRLGWLIRALHSRMKSFKPNGPERNTLKPAHFRSAAG